MGRFRNILEQNCGKDEVEQQESDAPSSVTSHAATSGLMKKKKSESDEEE